jgi:hypothetical protein
VYKPVDDHDPDPGDKPLVVLVVGSAWLGHRSIIYTGTSWWNSSGPKNVTAKQGCVTVCIRHRGSFPRIRPHGTLWYLALASIPLALFIPPAAGWNDDNQTSALKICMCTTTLLLLWALMALASHGAADFDQMLHDVADALLWLQQHKDTELLTLPKRYNHEEGNKMDATSSTKQPFVFGGYSSGGHVAATLLQRPDLFSSRGLPHPEHWIDAAIFISGVLAVRPTSTSASQWCTDLVTRVVFGKSGAAQLPSPLHTIDKHPPIRHLLIGCRKEVFGLPWLDVFFCSKEFSQQLQHQEIPSKWVEVDSDHWNILGSHSLSHALQNELGWIMNHS